MALIATFNVNSLRAHLSHVLAWLGEAKPDIALLQEIKAQESELPRLEFEALGYRLEAQGQKTYNGVAILSRRPLRVTARALPGDASDSQARYLEAEIDLRLKGSRQNLRIASIYLPNGNPTTSEKFAYKLGWLERLDRHAAGLLASEAPIILGGDFNVAPQDTDVYDPKAFAEDALCRPESRARFRKLLHRGYVDAFRHCHGEAHRYSFWDYQGGAWSKDEGLRIDHLLLSPQAADALEDCDIDRKPRAQEKPSDHTPVWCRVAEADVR